MWKLTIMLGTVLLATAATAQKNCCFLVPNEDMLPTLQKGQSVSVTPIGGIEEVRRGDIVIFTATIGGAQIIERVVCRETSLSSLQENLA